MNFIEYFHLFFVVVSNVFLLAFFIIILTRVFFVRLKFIKRNTTIDRMPYNNIMKNTHSYLLVASYVCSSVDHATHPDMNAFHFSFVFIELALAFVMYFLVYKTEEKNKTMLESNSARFLSKYSEFIKIN